MVALCLSLIDFIYLFMKFKETLAPEKRLKSLQAALNQAITYVNPISLFNFQSLDNLKEEELASIKTIGKNKVKSHYIEVAQGDIFMEQKMRFGLVLGRLAVLKKKLGSIMSNF